MRLLPRLVCTSTYSSVAAGAPFAIEQIPGISVSESRVLKLQRNCSMRTLLTRNVHPNAGGVSMRRALITVVLAGVLVAAGAVPSMAQTVTPTFDDLRAESHRGETVYVTDLAGARTKGRVLKISANSVVLIVKKQTREWPTSEVTWITQRRGHAGRGALIGLAVGAVIGPVLVAMDSGTDDYLLFFVAPFSACLGAGAGAAIGAAIRPERVLYAAPSPPSAHVFELGVAPGAIGLRAQLRF